MKELTFLTFEGTTKICSIPEDTILNYNYLIATIRKELSVQHDYRIKVYKEECEDALNPSSDIQSHTKYFVLFEQINQLKTDELRHFLTSDYLKIVNKREILDINKVIVYNRIEKLINAGACVESLYSKSDFDNVGDIIGILLYIVRCNDTQLLKLLFNNGLDVNSPPIKKYFLGGHFTKGGLILYNLNDIIDIFILYKIDLSYHYDLKSFEQSNVNTIKTKIIQNCYHTLYI
jgi:hypothetical protein